jgi:hypothetical protein
MGKSDLITPIIILGALAVGGYFLYKKFGGIFDAIGGAGQAITETGQTIVNEATKPIVPNKPSNVVEEVNAPSLIDIAVPPLAIPKFIDFATTNAYTGEEGPNAVRDSLIQTVAQIVFGDSIDPQKSTPTYSSNSGKSESQLKMHQGVSGSITRSEVAKAIDSNPDIPDLVKRKFKAGKIF